MANILDNSSLCHIYGTCLSNSTLESAHTQSVDFLSPKAQTLFGYDQGVFSGVVISQDYLNTLDLHGPENTNTLAIITSIYDIGCFFGALVAFTMGETIGRK